MHGGRWKRVMARFDTLFQKAGRSFLSTETWRFVGHKYLLWMLITSPLFVMWISTGWYFSRFGILWNGIPNRRIILNSDEPTTITQNQIKPLPTLGYFATRKISITP